MAAANGLGPFARKGMGVRVSRDASVFCTGGETADTYGSGPYALKSVEVQLLSRAPCPVRLASLGHRPLKAETTGANPVLGTNLYETDHIRSNMAARCGS